MYHHLVVKFIICGIVLLSLIMPSVCMSQNETVKLKKTELEKLEPVTLFSFKTSYTVKKGQRLEFSYEQNASIGTAVDYRLEDDAIIGYVKTEVSTPNAVEGAGGHFENITFIFEALEIGTAKIIVQEYFRLEPKEEHEFIITIEE